MLDMTPKLAEGASVIASYGEGGFTINGQRYAGSVFVLPTSVTPWNAQDPFAESSLAALMEQAHGTEILLIGTDTTHVFIPPTIRQAIKQRFNAVIEPMDTGAACRTFNILLAEGRAVGAAIVAV